MLKKDLKVLICDDSVFVRKNLKNLLSQLGVETIFEACDGKQAIEMYKENNPDIVFMDIIMPVITGIDAVKQILAYDKNAKVVMASSVGTQNYLKDAINAGAYEFLQKPFNSDSVEKIIDSVAKGE